MGYGEVAGNGSVHWKFDHEDGPGKMKCKKDKKRPKGDHEINYEDVAFGRDPAPGGIGKQKKGYFDVRLRFDSKAEADKAFAEAVAQGREENGHFFVHVDIRAAEPTSDPDKSPAEVKVEW